MKNVHILKKNQNLQSWKIQDEFSLINLTKFELGNQRKLCKLESFLKNRTFNLQ